MCVCVFFPFILDAKFVECTSLGHTGGKSHRISHPPSFCGACLYWAFFVCLFVFILFSEEKIKNKQVDN